MNTKNTAIVNNSMTMLDLLQARLKVAIEGNDRDMLDMTIRAMETELKFVRGNVMTRLDTTSHHDLQAVS